MSEQPVIYPAPVYLMDGGDLATTYRPVSHEPELLYATSGTRVHYLATGASTGEKFGLYRWEMQGGSGGAEPHFHRSITESFYVLEGTIAVFDGRTWIDTQPGDWVHVPEGGIHGFKNRSSAPASMLLHFAPGAPREGYFECLPDMGGRPEQDRSAFFIHHDTFWV